MVKKLFILVLLLSLVVIIPGKTYSQDGPTMPAKVVRYSIIPVNIPLSGSSMTKGELDELMTDGEKTRYSFGKRIVVPEIIAVPDNTEKAVDDAAKYFGTLQLYLENLALRLDKDPSVPKIEILGNVKTGCQKLINAISGSIEGPAENLVGSTGVVRQLVEDIERHDGYIDALWMRTNGLQRVTLQAELLQAGINSLEQRWTLYDEAGNEVSNNFKFVVAHGNLGGGQRSVYTKIYAIALESDGSFTVLGDPDIHDRPIKNGRFEIILSPIQRHVSEMYAKKLLRFLQLTEKGIDELFPNTL